MTKFIHRIIRAAKLDATLYKEVGADKTALGQSIGVVILSAMAYSFSSPGVTGPEHLVIAAIAGLAGWLAWVWLTYFVGTKILPEPQTKAHMDELLRAIGFSCSPGILGVLGVIQPLAGILGFVIGIWMLCAIIIAVRQTFGYKSTGRAIGVCAIAWLILLLGMLLLAIGLRD